MRVVGIDLAGKSENPTGFCILTDEGTDSKEVYSDLDILKEIENAKPDIIAIDAPFWIQKMGDRIIPWRRSEELLLKRGFRPISIALPSMTMLARRAIHLVSVLRQRRYNVIEVFPQATEKILGLSKAEKKSEHEYDALLCALTAKAYLENKYENLDGIIIPK